MRVVVVRLGGVARRLGRRHQPVLRDDRDVRARRRLRHLAAHVDRARLGGPLGALGAAGRCPGRRGDERNRELQVAGHLVLRREPVDVHDPAAVRRLSTRSCPGACRGRCRSGAGSQPARACVISASARSTSCDGDRHRRIAVQRALHGGRQRDLLGRGRRRAGRGTAVGTGGTRRASASDGISRAAATERRARSSRMRGPPSARGRLHRVACDFFEKRSSAV